MMGRFTGDTPETRAKVVAEEPVGRMGTRGDSSGCDLGVFRRGRLYNLPRYGDRWWPNAAVNQRPNQADAAQPRPRVVTRSQHIYEVRPRKDRGAALYSRSHPIETHEHAGDFKELPRSRL
jgi:hypothetical protein